MGYVFVLFFFGLWVHALFSSLPFRYQYQCNWLPGKISPGNVSSRTLNLAQLNSTSSSSYYYCWACLNGNCKQTTLHSVNDDHQLITLWSCDWCHPQMATLIYLNLDNKWIYCIIKYLQSITNLLYNYGTYAMCQKHNMWITIRAAGNMVISCLQHLTYAHNRASSLCKQIIIIHSATIMMARMMFKYNY